jgi:hypothetical protein
MLVRDHFVHVLLVPILRVGYRDPRSAGGVRMLELANRGSDHRVEL